MKSCLPHPIALAATAALVALFVAPSQPAAAQPNAASPRSVLSEPQWRRVDAAAERALGWLAAQQAEDGSFATHELGQPGVTGLVAMAFMAWGHEPGSGPYGECLTRAVNFIAAQQRDNGLISTVGPDGPLVRQPTKYAFCVPAPYNHAIGGLALCEIYGNADAEFGGKLRPTIEKALAATLTMQRWRAGSGSDGGWRYLHTTDGDLSVAGWHLMFLRSAKNAGFDVPEASIDSAVQFVKKCYSPQYGTFEYDLKPDDRRSRAMAAAGIMALAHAGLHHRPEAESAADWILQHRFTRYNAPWEGTPGYRGDRYHYGVFYCCQAMYQMGGRYWREFYPETAFVLVNNQNADGSWDAERNQDTLFGQSYTTALVLLGLGAPNQLLPVFQR